MKEELREALSELIASTLEKEQAEVEYLLERSKLLFSAEVNSLANQTMRDAQVTILLDQMGWERKIAEARTKYKIDYYKWSTLKSIIDGKAE